jgi:hypothetical protein
MQKLGTKPDANALLPKLWVKHNVMIKLIWKTQCFKTGFMWFAGEIKGNLLWKLGNTEPLLRV